MQVGEENVVINSDSGHDKLILSMPFYDVFNNQFFLMLYAISLKSLSFK